MTEIVYPLSVLRTLALHKQWLTIPYGSEPKATADTICQAVEDLLYVQIDTMHVVQRSQYLVLWSRLGSYDPSDFDRLIFQDGERRLFEYWGHAASILPLRDYRYTLPVMRIFREKPGKRWEKWLSDPRNRETVEGVRERIRQEGAVRANAFERGEPRESAWWNWKPAKSALELMFAGGDLMIADRVNFQRAYDLRERVLPEWVDTSEPSREEANRYYVEQSVKALGICRAAQAAEYAYMRRGDARPFVEALLREGVFVEVEGELHKGQKASLIVHRDNLPLLEQVAEGAIQAERTTFLSPFDSLFWARGRDEDLWGFRQVLESYKREPDRIWGYFCLPILYHDRLVGRFDPKLDRKEGVLHLRALYLEPGIEPEEALVVSVAEAMRDFMRFHAAKEMRIEKSDPPDFGKKLAESL